jgi:hypothetical protein
VGFGAKKPIGKIRRIGYEVLTPFGGFPHSPILGVWGHTPQIRGLGLAPVKPPTHPPFLSVLKDKHTNIPLYPIVRSIGGYWDTHILIESNYLLGWRWGVWGGEPPQIAPLPPMLGSKQFPTCHLAFYSRNSGYIPLLVRY